MRILENKEKNLVDFTDLSVGDCFRYDGQLYIKSDCDQEAVGLVDGNALSELCNTRVTPVNAEVHIID